MMTCEDAQQICTKNQYKEASWREKFNLLMHLVVCKTCNSYSRKNARLTRLCEKASLHTLSRSEKEHMKDAILRQK